MGRSKPNEAVLRWQRASCRIDFRIVTANGDLRLALRARIRRIERAHRTRAGKAEHKVSRRRNIRPNARNCRIRDR